MKKLLFFLTTLIVSFLVASPLYSAKEEEPRLHWVSGPEKVDVGDIASLKISKGYYYLGEEGTRIMMERMGNKLSGRELGFVSHAKENWFAVFEFDEIGYVKDDDKDALDADAILDSYKKGTENANEWRKEKGIPLLHVLSWHKKPSYDAKTNNLEWAMLLESEGKKIINYNIRYLGRKGVMEVVLVCGTDELKRAVPQLKKILADYSFKTGNKYSEWIEGDKVAEYGLAALIAGGAAAAATKAGFLKKFWKLIVGALVAIGAFLKKFFRSLFGMEEKNTSVIGEKREEEEEETEEDQA